MKYVSIVLFLTALVRQLSSNQIAKENFILEVLRLWMTQAELTFYTEHYQRLIKAVEAYLDRGEDKMDSEFIVAKPGIGRV